MTNVTYEVTTPKGNVEVKTLTRAEEIVAEKGGTFKTKYTKVAENPPVISEARRAFLKSGKPLVVCRAY